MFEQKFYFTPKLLNNSLPSHTSSLNKSLASHPKCEEQKSCFHPKWFTKASIASKMCRTKVLLPPQMINKSFHRIQNVRTKVLINILTQTVNKSLPLHLNFFEQESCFASKLVNRSLPSHPKCLTTVFLHIQNVWTKVLFHVHNICN